MVAIALFEALGSLTEAGRARPSLDARCPERLKPRLTCWSYRYRLWAMRVDASIAAACGLRPSGCSGSPG